MSQRIKTILVISSIFLLTVAVVGGVYFGVKNNQDIRSRAANGNKDGCSNTCSGNPPDCTGNTTNGTNCSTVTVATMPDTMNAWGFTHPTYLQPVSCTSRDAQKADCSCQASTGTPYCWLPLVSLVRNVANQGHRWAMYVYDKDGNLIDGGPNRWVLYDDNPSNQDRWGNSNYMSTDSVVHCNERKEYREQADLYSPGTWIETGQVIYATATGPGCAAKCDSVAMEPNDYNITSSSNSRTFTVSGSGEGPLSYSWAATGGTFSSTAGQTVTWTAPTLGADADNWVIQATVTNSSGSTSPDICKKTVTYTPPGAPTCDSLGVDPAGLVITATGQTKTLTASGTGTGVLTYTWTGENLSATTGQTVTWTAPTLGATADSWTVTAVATDSLGRASGIGGCNVTFTYTPPNGPSCESLTMNPDDNVITLGGQTRSLTANITGTGALTYSWTASGGAINGQGQTVTWTAPETLPNTSTQYTINVTATDSLGRVSEVGNCHKTLTYTLPGAPVCESLTMVPENTVISEGGQSRSFTANITGTGNLTYSWAASGGTITGSGSTVTWTAPETLPDTDTQYSINVTATDFLGRVSAVGDCSKTLSYSIIPSGVCQRVSADKSLSSIEIGDVVTFTGFGTVPVDNPNTIDLISFTVLKDGVVDVTQPVVADVDPDNTTATSKSYKASFQYTVGSAGSYSVVIKVHESGTPTSEWRI